MFLLERKYTCIFFEVFVTFPCGVPGQVWYLILSIFDLCFKVVSMAEWLVHWTTKLATWVRFSVAAGLPTVFFSAGYCYQQYWPRLDNRGGY